MRLYRGRHRLAYLTADDASGGAIGLCVEDLHIVGFVRAPDLPLLLVVDIHRPGRATLVPARDDEFILQLVWSTDQQIVLALSQAIEEHPVRIALAISAGRWSSGGRTRLGHAARHRGD